MGLGTWQSEPGHVGAAVLVALTVVCRHIDCASICGNEAEIGSALPSSLTAGRWCGVRISGSPQGCRTAATPLST